jgi:amino acid transporter
MLVGVFVTVGWVIVVGLFTFSPPMAFDFPPEAYSFDGSLAASVGAASVLAMYSYGGYNQVCNIGEESRIRHERSRARSCLTCRRRPTSSRPW